MNVFIDLRRNFGELAENASRRKEFRLLKDLEDASDDVARCASSGKLRLFPRSTLLALFGFNVSSFPQYGNASCSLFASHLNSLDAKERSKNCFKVSLTSSESAIYWRKESRN
jgi:hypothetical protein